MEAVRWSYRPTVEAPIVLAAFEGWNDAGDAASSAVTWMADRWDVSQFAEIDPEDFFDFTSVRPQVRIEDGRRVIDWPTTELHVGKLPNSERDIILVKGVEPGLRWRTFATALIEVFVELGVSQVFTMGALLAEVAHTRPIGLVGTADDPELVARYGLRPSRYEGPTGIVGVLHTLARDAGLSTASLWATVPSYVPGAPCPKATLALVTKAADLLGVGVVTTDLEIATASYERQIDELVTDDDETQAYVSALEQRHDEATGDELLDAPDELIAEVERFLRNRDD